MKWWIVVAVSPSLPETIVRDWVGVASFGIDGKFHELFFWNAGGSRSPVRTDLPFLRGRVEIAASPFSSLIVCSDLQGRVRLDGESGSLLGVAVAEELLRLANRGEIQPLENTLILLAGDFFTVPACTKRGGHGDVRPVWEAFARTGATIVGVAGNHDYFWAPADNRDPRVSAAHLDAFRRHTRWAFLDWELHRAGEELLIGGVSGSIGNPRRHFRYSPMDFRDRLDNWFVGIDTLPDVLLFHQSPDLGEPFFGEAVLTDWLREIDFRGLLFCGHCRWPEVFRQYRNSTIINANERVIVAEVVRST